MRLSMREARARFLEAAEAAARGERVVATGVGWGHVLFREKVHIPASRRWIGPTARPRTSANNKLDSRLRGNEGLGRPAE